MLHDTKSCFDGLSLDVLDISQFRYSTPRSVHDPPWRRNKEYTLKADWRKDSSSLSVMVDWLIWLWILLKHDQKINIGWVWRMEQCSGEGGVEDGAVQRWGGCGGMERASLTLSLPLHFCFAFSRAALLYFHMNFISLFMCTHPPSHLNFYPW